MVDAQIILNLDEADKGELPTVSNLSEGGRAIAYGQRTRRKKHFTPDTMPTQTTIRFDDYDRELAESEVEDG
jgi:hypothetical protein